MNNKERFLEICRNDIHREGIEDLLQWLEKSDFFVCPASSRFHLSVRGGLLLHSLDVYDELNRLLAAYPDIKPDKETIAIISLFHDLCKVNMYVPEKRNRKNEFGQWESYEAFAIKEKFCYGGHGSKSVYIINNYMKLKPEEAVAINCHMGSWGDVDQRAIGDAYSHFPLAWLLHVADESATYIVEVDK